MIVKIHDYNIKRLNGDNILFNGYGALLDIVSADSELNKFSSFVINQIQTVIDKLNLPAQIYVLNYSNGVIVAIKMPFDLRAYASQILEKLYSYSYAVYTDVLHDKLDLERINQFYIDSINLDLRSLNELSIKKSINCLEQDNIVYLGSGKGCYSLNVDDINNTIIPWDSIYDIPSVIVTGTNGKTTTVRLTNYIAKFSGKVTGYCSTDWVMINDQIIDEGDYSGVQGNTLVFKDKKVDIAILEVARGGIAKRGLATKFVNAALVTNVTEDHLGLSGISTVEDLAKCKFIVHNSVKPSGYSIVNLDDVESLKINTSIQNKKIYISRKLDLIRIKKYFNSDNDIAIYIKDGGIYCCQANVEKYITDVNIISITYNGEATHNIENVLCAIGLSLSLGIELDVIAKALNSYINDNTNNHGRFNLFDVNGAMFIIDYGHNLAAIRNIINFANKLTNESSKTTILLGFTGDRINIQEPIAKMVCDLEIDKVIIKTFDNYTRGFVEKGEVANLLQECLSKSGFNMNNILAVVDSELEAVKLAVQSSSTGDVNIMLVHEEVTTVINYIKTIGEQR